MTGAHSFDEAKKLAHKRRDYVLGRIFDLSGEQDLLAGQWIDGVPTIATFSGISTDGETLNKVFYRIEIVAKKPKKTPELDKEAAESRVKKASEFWKKEKGA
jgi:hypothetical protein